jgi:hypothetical protein
MTWYHYSSDRNIRLKNVEHTKNIAGKPCGFWLSYNDEWLDWCKDQGFYTFNKDSYYRYEYSLKDAHLYKLSSIYDLYSFQDRYSLGQDFSIRIDWKKVALEYDGLVINNFSQIRDSLMNGGSLEHLYSALKCKDISDMEVQIKKKRDYFDYLWFTMFDISCACVWNVNKLSLIDKKYYGLNSRT